jgi:hypothetical protein
MTCPAVCSSETLVTTHMTIPYHNPKDHHFWNYENILPFPPFFICARVFNTSEVTEYELDKRHVFIERKNPGTHHWASGSLYTMVTTARARSWLISDKIYTLIHTLGMIHVSLSEIWGSGCVVLTSCSLAVATNVSEDPIFPIDPIALLGNDVM